MKTAKDFLFHVGEEDGSVFATITSREFWDQQRCVDASENEDEAIGRYGLYSLTESDYAPEEPMSKEQLRAKLLADGFVEDPAFTAYLERNK